MVVHCASGASRAPCTGTAPIEHLTAKDDMSTDPTPDLLGSSTTRRQLLALAAVGGAGLAAVRSAAPAEAAAAPGAGTNSEVVRLTVLGTTDLHNNVYN